MATVFDYHVSDGPVGHIDSVRLPNLSSDGRQSATVKLLGARLARVLRMSSAAKLPRNYAWCVGLDLWFDHDTKKTLKNLAAKDSKCATKDFSLRSK